MTPADYAKANCRGVAASLMFPDRGEDVEPAKTVCRGCTVKAACLEWALDNHEHWGVWGETSGNERKAIRKARRRAEATGEAA